MQEQSLGPYKSTHDLVGFHPVILATPGDPGSSFVQLHTQAVSIERILADLPYGSDLFVRIDGDVARAVSTLTAPGSTLTGLTLEFTLDGEDVAVEFEAEDTTFALAAKRINFAAGVQCASINTANKLVIEGAKTGGRDAADASMSYGEVLITGGTALAALGLTESENYGSGTDERVGAGIYARTFPPGALPQKIELSGSSASSTAPARFWVSGKKE